jgi:hypothetical protein
MRVLVDLGSHITGSPEILQAEKTPPVGDAIPFNGKFSIPVLEGTQIAIDSSSYVLPVDGGDIASQTYAMLLAKYPMFGHVYYNPLLTADHIGDLDLTGQYIDSSNNAFNTRAQIGRATGPNDGVAPNSVAILPENTTTSPNRPGVLVTDSIDISAYTSGVGANEFMVYWKLYEIETSHDIRSDLGLHSGSNTPALRSIIETDQEPSDFNVYFSSGPCNKWVSAGRLQPIGICSKLTDFRLAFVNTGSTKRYLATFGVLF